MTVTTTETLSVNGVILNTLAKNIGSLTGRLKTPARKTKNVMVGGRHGSIWTPRKKFDEGEIVLPMWVLGCDDDGLVPTGQNARDLFFSNVDILTQLFSSSDLLDVRWTTPKGVRQCWAEVLEVIDMTATSSSPSAKFGVVLNVPGAFWQDVVDITQEFVWTTGGKSLTSFASATAPMDDLEFDAVGPITNPRMTHRGRYVQFGGTVPANNTLTLKSATWSVVGAGFAPAYSAVTHVGDTRFLSLDPDDPPVVSLAGTAITSATKFRVRGKRKYLIG